MTKLASPSVISAFTEKAGHIVIPHHAALDEGTNDTVVCDTAIQNEAILVAVDGDMKHLSKRFNNTSERFKKLSLVMISCTGVLAAKRMDQSHELDRTRMADQRGKNF